MVARGLAEFIGRSVRALIRCFGRGHGSALPGLVVERLAPNFLRDILDELPMGVVVISGTNGKTTTTKIVTDLLTSHGLKVFTNPSGSNFIRGVISSALPQLHHGRLDADIAVLELDEAYAALFVRSITPKYSLLLNVLRDQLDRFGEIDHTAQLLETVASKTSAHVVLNWNDPRLRPIATRVSAESSFFGYSGQASRFYHTDEELHQTQDSVRSPTPLAGQDNPASVQLTNVQDGTARYLIDGRQYQARLQLFGIHNALNGAAALALVKTILGTQFQPDAMVSALAAIKPAFGRGEDITFAGHRIRLILVKNPSGFQLSLDSVRNEPTMIVINDEYADGRDVSWLYDVDFHRFSPDDGTPISLSGTRAYDMALRLAYGNVGRNHIMQIEPDVEQSVRHFVAALDTSDSGDAQIFATYTAMLTVRGILRRLR